MGSGAAWPMTTAIDTNVIVALWDRDPSLSSAAQSALDGALGRGTLVNTATVFAELMAAPGRSESFLDSFFRETGISIDWALDESVWRTAGLPGLRCASKETTRRGPPPHSGGLPHRCPCSRRRPLTAHARRSSLSHSIPASRRRRDLVKLYLRVYLRHQSRPTRRRRCT